MERIFLTQNLSISRLIYGMWRLGDDSDTTPGHVQKKIETCLSQGITTIDQADIYGGYLAEELFGAALKSSPKLRDQIEIITKCDILVGAGRYANVKVKHYDTSAAHIQASVDHSLRLMNIDHIDLLLIHRPDPLMDHNETGKALDDVIASGKVLSVGVSNFKPYDWTLLQSAMKNPLVTNQIEISVTENSALTNGDLAFLQERSKVPMAWSPLAGGALFSGNNSELLKILTEVGEGDAAAAAVAWLLAHPAQIAPVMGTNSLARIKNLSRCLKLEMSRETWFDIYGAANGQEVP